MHSRRANPDPSAAAEDPGLKSLAALAQLASIVESSDDAIISKDLSGTILTWNSGAQGVYGYSSEEAVGQPIAMLIPPDRMEEEEVILAKMRSGERVRHFETVRMRKGGKLLDVSLSISPIRTGDRIIGVSHVARDISERKRLERATAQLASIVESSEDAIISKDLNAIIQTWNAGAERVYGYTGAEVIGRNINLLLPEERVNEEQEILAKLRRGERVDHFESTRLRKGGTLIDVSLTISPMRDVSGRVIGASHVARDITARKAFENQMRQTQRLESLGVLAGGIAHDFNNLLTGILGNASLVSEVLPPSHPVQPQLEDLMLAAKRAADLTIQLLAYSGKGQFVIAPFNLSELVSEITKLVRASVPKSVVIRLDLDTELPDIEGDRSQIQQLVMNLIVNGAESIPENRSGTVTVRTGTQHLDDSYVQGALPGGGITAGLYVFLEVRDEGCGMDEQTRSRIFEPFFTTKFPGRGLGLAAALGTVKAHKGAIRVSSTLGVGSTFKVFFPAMPRPRSEGTGAQESARGTVLVVDDEESVRKVIKRSLEIDGYRVLLATNGKEAVDLFREMPASINLVVLDLTMPVMSGDEVLKQLRAIRPDLPVILSSGYSEAEALRRFGISGAAAFVQKPYTSAELRQKVRSTLSG